MKTIQVKDLRKGMVLSSGTEVLNNPLELCRTPKGKVEIEVKYPNGNVRTQTWGKYTTVKILQNPL